MEFPNPHDWIHEKWCSGNGFVIEGEVVHRRTHTVILKHKPNSSNALPTKFIAFRVRIDSGDAIERMNNCLLFLLLFFQRFFFNYFHEKKNEKQQFNLKKLQRESACENKNPRMN